MIFVHRGTSPCESDTGKVTQTAARVAGETDSVDSVLGAVPAQFPMDPDTRAERRLCVQTDRDGRVDGDCAPKHQFVFEPNAN
jgi:hypothetical protein